MPPSCNEDLRFRVVMDEFLGCSIDLVAATLHMSLSIVQRYVLKCLNNEEVNAYRKDSLIMHPRAEFVPI